LSTQSAKLGRHELVAVRDIRRCHVEIR